MSRLKLTHKVAKAITQTGEKRWVTEASTIGFAGHSAIVGPNGHLFRYDHTMYDNEHEVTGWVYRHHLTGYQITILND